VVSWKLALDPKHEVDWLQTRSVEDVRRGVRETDTGARVETKNLGNDVASLMGEPSVMAPDEDRLYRLPCVAYGSTR